MTTFFSSMVKLELNDLRALLGGLLVRMHEGRRDQLNVWRGSLRSSAAKAGAATHEGGGGGAYQCGSAGDHDTLLLVPTFKFDVTLLP